jgi:hypothetical protein
MSKIELPAKENEVKSLIQKYLSDESLLRETMQNPKLEFGFRFVFPGGVNPSGQSVGKNFIVIKPKSRDYLQISIGTKISPPHMEMLNTLSKSKKTSFFNELQKLFFQKGYLFVIDFQNNKYVLTDRIYFEKYETISKNIFFKSVHNLFGTFMCGLILLQEYCADKTASEEIFMDKSQDFNENIFVTDTLQVPTSTDYRTVHIMHLKKMVDKLREYSKDSKEIRDLVEEVCKEYDVR